MSQVQLLLDLDKEDGKARRKEEGKEEVEGQQYWCYHGKGCRGRGDVPGGGVLGGRVSSLRAHPNLVGRGSLLECSSFIRLFRVQHVIFK